MRQRELTYEERACWGVCPVCGAEDGQPCDPDQGLALGMDVLGRRPQGGAHLGRLNAAPFVVETVVVR